MESRRNGRSGGRKGEAMRKNQDIRIRAMEKGVYFWQIASWFCITPESFSRIMREELDEKDKRQVMWAIECAAREQEEWRKNRGKEV